MSRKKIVHGVKVDKSHSITDPLSKMNVIPKSFLDLLGMVNSGNISGCIDAIKKMPVSDLDMSFGMNNENSLLIAATEMNLKEIVKVLLECGAHPGVTSTQTKDCMELALRKYDIELIKLFIPYYKENLSHFFSIIMTETDEMDEDSILHLVNYFLETNGHDCVEYVSKDHTTCLHAAAISARPKVLLRLLEVGADQHITSVDNHGRTPLQCAEECFANVRGDSSYH
eukprot:gene13243-28031_t